MHYLQERQVILSTLPKYILRIYSAPRRYVSSKNTACTSHPRYHQQQPYQRRDNPQYTYIQQLRQGTHIAFSRCMARHRLLGPDARHRRYETNEDSKLGPVSF